MKLNKADKVEHEAGSVYAWFETGKLIIEWRGRRVSLLDNIGARYLHELLVHPWERIGSLELHLRYFAGQFASDLGGEERLRDKAAGGNEAPIAMTDRKTILAVLARLRAIEAELVETEDWNDHGRRDDLLEERDGLQRYLRETLTEGGKIRSFGDGIGNIRYAVFRSLHRALERISRQDEELGRYLGKWIRIREPLGYLPQPES